MNTQNLYSSFKRLKDFPLDPSSLFKTKDALELYITSSKIAHSGQVVVVCGEEDNNGVYLICGEKGNFSLLKTADISDIEGLSTLIEELSGRTTDLESALSTLGENTENLKDDLNKKYEDNKALINTTSEVISGRIDSIEKTVQETTKTINESINTVTADAAKNLNSAIKDVTEIINSVDVKADTNATNITKNAERINTVESEYKAEDVKIRAEISSNKENIATNTANIESISNTIKTMQQANTDSSALIAKNAEDITGIKNDITDIFGELENITSFEYEVIDTLASLNALPDEDKLRKGYIYFVLEDENEYMFINYTDGLKLQCLGHRTVDITKYYTTDEITNILLSYVTNSKLEEILSEYDTIDDVNKKINDYRDEVNKTFETVQSTFTNETASIRNGMSYLATRTESQEYTNNAVKGLKEGDVADNKNRISTIENRLGVLDSETSIEKLIEKNADNISKNDVAIGNNKVFIDGLSEGIKALQTKNEAIDSKIAGIEDTVGTNSTNITNLDSKIKNEISRLEDGQIKTNKENISKLDARLSVAENDFDEFLKIKEGYERQVIINKESVNVALKAIGDVKELETNILINGQPQSTTIISKIKKLESTDDNLESRLIALESGIDYEENTGTTNNIFTQLKGMRDQITENTETISNINNNINIFDKEIGSIKTKVSELNTDNDDIKGTLDEYKQEIEQLNKDRLALSQKVSTLESEVNTLKSEKNILKNRVDSIELVISKIVGSIMLDEDGKLLIGQEDKIPTVKAVVDLLSHYKFNPETPEIPDDSPTSEGTVSDGALAIRNFRIVSSDEGNGVVLSGITVDKENQKIIIK